MHWPADVLRGYGLFIGGLADFGVRGWVWEDHRSVADCGDSAQPGDSIPENLGAGAFCRLHRGHHFQHQHLSHQLGCLYSRFAPAGYHNPTAVKIGNLPGQQVESDHIFAAILCG